jgi:PAS domain S-box-containing protein
MANKELTKSANQLLPENEELKSCLAETGEASETPYRIILEEMDEGAVLTNANGTILYCNKGFANLISEPVEKIVGSKCRSFVSDRERAGFGRLLKDGLKGKANGVISFLNKDHKLAVHLKLSIRSLSLGMICIIASDVTEMRKQQKKLENLIDVHKLEIIKAKETLNNDILEINKSKEALQESEYRLSSVYASMSDGLAIHDVIYDSSGAAVDYIITDVNPTFEKITGLKKAVTLGKNASEVYSVKEAPYLDIYSEVASSGNPISFETFFQPMNKHFHVSVFSPGKGRFATVFQDITARKQTEEELQVILHRFYLILSKMQNGILLLTPESKIEFVNQPFCDMFDLKESPAELLNLSAKETILKIKGRYEDPDAAISRIQEIVKLGKPVIGEDVGMISGRTLLRDFIPIYLGKKQSGRLWNHIDITERKLISDTQNFLLQSSYSSSGENFFESLAKFLAGILGMDYVCIDKIEGDNLTARTVAIFNNGRIDPNISYTLKETPCGDVVGKTICCFPQNVCNLFPNDSALQELKAESYVGTTLWSHDGKPIGLIAVIGRKPLIATRLAEVVIKQVAVRAAGELERTQADDALRKSEERLRIALEAANLGTWDLDLKTGNAVHSLRHDQIFGYQDLQNEWTYEIAAQHMLPEYQPIFREAFSRAEKTGELSFEGKVRWPDGSIHWIAPHGRTYYDTERNPVRMIGVVADITQKIKAEEDLKESESKLWTILNATEESIYMFDREGIIAMSNSTGLERLKASSGNEIIGHHFSEFMTPVTAKSRQAKLDEVFRSGRHLEFEDERDGRTYHHNFSPVFKDDKVSFIVTYSTDITERKRADIKLKESEDRFRTIAESLPVLISINRINDSKILFANEHHEKSFGFKKGEMTGKKIFDIFYSPLDRINLSHTLKESGRTYSTEMKVNKPDGTPFWIMTSVRKIMFMNEPSFLTASIDITETKKSQEELLQLNRTLNAHNKSSQVMMHSDNELNYLNEVCKIIIEDCGYKMVWIGYAQNDKRRRVKPVAFYGFDKGYIDQMNITWGDNERGRGPTGMAIRTGRPSMCKNMLTDPAFEPWREEAGKRGYASSLVLPLITKGKPFGAISIYSKEPDSFADSEINLLSDLADDLAYGISYIRLKEAERAATMAIKKSEAQLKELNATKDKFFNIIAHDLKNPFTSLLGSSELLYNNINKMSPENIKKLSLILNDSAKGGYAILLNLLDWSRSQTGILKYKPEKINLKNLIDENISNLQLSAANKEIRLFSETKDNLFVIADKNMINTLLRNLLNNAVKFTHRNGKVVMGAVTDSGNVIISVKDTGIGISEDRIEKLFRIDTKHSMPGTENEQGTGLGLKLCQEFVDKMGGKIWVESIENKGSTFKFSIPVKEGRLH